MDILISKEDRILTMQFNRPDKKNAITAAMYQAMADALREAETDAERVRLAADLNRRAMEFMHYLPLGYYWQPSAWLRNVTGVLREPATVFWNMGKS